MQDKMLFVIITYSLCALCLPVQLCHWLVRLMCTHTVHLCVCAYICVFVIHCV